MNFNEFLNWKMIFIYETNHPVDVTLLKSEIQNLPPNTLVYIENNIQQYFSRLFYTRLKYIPQ